MSRPCVKITFSNKENEKKFVSKLIDDDSPMFSCSYNMVLVEFSYKHFTDIERIALNIDSSAKIERIWNGDSK